MEINRVSGESAKDMVVGEVTHKAMQAGRRKEYIWEVVVEFVFPSLSCFLLAPFLSFFPFFFFPPFNAKD